MNSRIFGLLLFLGIIPFFLNDIYNPYLKEELFWIFDIILFLIFPLILYFLLIKTNYISNKEIGFSDLLINDTDVKNNKIEYSLVDEDDEIDERDYIFVLIIFPIIIHYIYKFSFMFFGIFFSNNYFQNGFSYKALIPQSGSLKILAVLYLSLTAALTEEFYFRALILKFINNIYKGVYQFNIYIVLSSGLFALTHWGNGIINIFSTLIFGIIFAVFYYKTRNIVVLIFTHFVVDIIYFFGG